MPDEEEEGQLAEEGVVHTKRVLKPRGAGPAMDDPEADRLDPLLLSLHGGANRGRGGAAGRLASRLGPPVGGSGGGKDKEAELKAEERGDLPEVS